jgi:hypothetical protein
VTVTINETLYLKTDSIYDLDENDRTCYLNSDQMKLIGVVVGGYVKISGSRTTVATCYLWPPEHLSPMSRDSIGLTQISSESAGAPPLGATVAVSKIEVQPAKEIILSSYRTHTSEFVSQLNSSSLFRLRLMYSPLTKGDYITLRLEDHSEKSYRFNFQVMNMIPSDAAAVCVDENTAFRVLPKGNVEIAERIGRRSFFLERLYHLTTNGRRWVDAIGLGVELGFDVGEVKDILSYLHKEKLVEVDPAYFAFIDTEYPTLWKISISHKGKKNVESAKLNTSNGTKPVPKQVYNIGLTSMEFDMITRNQSFSNITGSSIINDSNVENTIIKIKEKYGEELFKNLNILKKVIEEVDDPAASAILDKFTGELVKPKPERSTLSKMLEGMQQLLPVISTITTVFTQIRSLLP